MKQEKIDPTKDYLQIKSKSFIMNTRYPFNDKIIIKKSSKYHK